MEAATGRRPPRGREARRQPGRSHAENRRVAATMLEAGLSHAVRQGRITEEQAARFRGQVTAVLASLPPGGMRRLLGNVRAYRWYANQDEVNNAYHQSPSHNPEVQAAAFYDPNDGTLHLDDNDVRKYAEEVGHAIDGMDQAVSNSPAWHRAYRRERGRLSGAEYPTSNRAEWFGRLVSVCLTDPEAWGAVRVRCRRSARIVERVLR